MRFVGWTRPGTAPSTPRAGSGGTLRAPGGQYALVEPLVGELAGGGARVEEGGVLGLQFAEVVEGLVVVLAEGDEGEEDGGVVLRRLGEGLGGGGLGVGGAVRLEDHQGGGGRAVRGLRVVRED